MNIYKVNFSDGNDVQGKSRLIKSQEPIALGEIIHDELHKTYRVVEILGTMGESIIEIKVEAEPNIFTVYNKNGFAFKFDANQGYSWDYATDEVNKVKVETSWGGQFVGDDICDRSTIEVWQNDKVLVAVFTQADVCNFDGKEFVK